MHERYFHGEKHILPKHDIAILELENAIDFDKYENFEFFKFFCTNFFAGTLKLDLCVYPIFGHRMTLKLVGLAIIL